MTAIKFELDAIISAMVTSGFNAQGARLALPEGAVPKSFTTDAPLEQQRATIHWEELDELLHGLSEQVGVAVYGREDPKAGYYAYILEIQTKRVNGMYVTSVVYALDL